MTVFISIILIGIIGFFQNMVFTGVSRSRNSGNPGYHRKWAYMSNSIWFVANVLIVKQVWETIQSGEWYVLLLTAIVYTICTAEGSTFMMKKMLESETGDKRVGAQKA